jgi:DNA-binding transcriptional MerR regulator
MTVSAVARRCGLTRSTLLYYEARGLLRRPARTGGNYRAYTEADVQRVQQICAYRKMGLPLADIATVLSRSRAGVDNAAAILERRLTAIEAEIETLRGHQRAILRLLQQSTVRRGTKMITKEKWVAIMRAAGLGEDAMHRWHREFEKAAPAEHQEFLEFLHIPSDEIQAIREWSRAENG